MCTVRYSLLYDKWCECYDVNNEEMSILKDNVCIRNKTVLDIGCGTGRLTMRLAQEAKRVYGIDVDDYSINVLNNKIADKGIKILKPIVKTFWRLASQLTFLILLFLAGLFILCPMIVIRYYLKKIHSWLNDEGKNVNPSATEWRI